jgi:hypothetical protein
MSSQTGQKRGSPGVPNRISLMFSLSRVMRPTPKPPAMARFVEPISTAGGSKLLEATEHLSEQDLGNGRVGNRGLASGMDHDDASAGEVGEDHPHQPE